MTDIYFHILLEKDQTGYKYPAMQVSVFESGKSSTPILLLNNFDIYRLVSESGWDKWGDAFMKQMEVKTKQQVQDEREEFVKKITALAVHKIHTEIGLDTLLIKASELFRKGERDPKKVITLIEETEKHGRR